MPLGDNVANVAHNVISSVISVIASVASVLGSVFKVTWVREQLVVAWED